MNTIYIFFDGDKVRIPFTDYDKGLFNLLYKTRMGQWDNNKQQYSILRSNYNPEVIKNVLEGKTYIEVGKEAENPVKVHGFVSAKAEISDETEMITNVTTPENYPPLETYPGMSTPSEELPDKFPEYWEKKLETEINARKYSPKTLKSYVYYNRELSRFLQKQPEDVNNGDIKRYLAFLGKNKQHSAATLNLNLSAFKFFYGNVLNRNFITEQKRARQDKNLPTVFSKYELKKIFDSVLNIKHRYLLTITYASGLRVSEVVKLKQEHVDLSRKVMRIEKSKGRKTRDTIMSASVIEPLQEYYRQYKITDWLFPGAYPGKHIAIRTAQYIFEHALKKSGVKKKGSIHDLRHTFATHLLESGTDITYIGELMGHKSILTTVRYTKVAKRKVLNIKSPFDTIDEADEG